MTPRSRLRTLGAGPASVSVTDDEGQELGDRIDEAWPDHPVLVRVLAEAHLEAHPRDGYVWTQYGDALRRLGCFAGAKAALERARELADTDTRRTTWRRDTLSAEPDRWSMTWAILAWPHVHPGDLLVAAVAPGEPFAVPIGNECMGERPSSVTAKSRAVAWVHVADLAAARALVASLP